ncbi:hypothetical protein CTA2_5479 [Colletotrichum tanaceti]|uniref:RING-type domain-containing protein n=1 Tax=Colletotrichum tanaceti TaxID=1306861 RepID=A0A4U6XCN8_9PEZI|nr:hypothetical protein CTA2_5479 [Colletotrichum tanaceti]TKW53508.1 hypothetical protein CTA1_12387 [Colletotrichum tanaceti]
MAPKKNNHQVASCHGMKTRAISRREKESSSSGSSSSGSSPSSSPEPVPKKVGRGSKRKMSESEESEYSSDDESPAKKTKVTRKPNPAAFDIDQDSEEESEEDSESDSEDGPTDYSDSNPEDDSKDEHEREPEENKTLVPVRGNSGPDLPPRGSPVPTLHVRSDGFWPAIRDVFMRALEDKSIKVDIPCIICGDETIVWGQFHWDSHQPHRDVRKTEVPAILWCGHIVGDECLARWKRARERAGEPHNCPVCRQSLECSTCAAPLVGWGLSPDCLVMTKETLHENPDQTRECNWCRAEVVLGEDVRHRGRHLARPRNPDTVRRLRQWFSIVRNRAEVEVRTGKHKNVDPALVPELILKEVFAEMKKELADLEVDVREDVDQTMLEIETLLNIMTPWTHVDYSQGADEEEEEEEEEVEGEQWDDELGVVFPPGREPIVYI